MPKSLWTCWTWCPLKCLLFDLILWKPGSSKLRHCLLSCEWLQAPQNSTSVFHSSTKRLQTRFWISSSLLPPLMNLMKPWRASCWSCSPSMISRGIKLYPTCPCPATLSLLSLYQEKALLPVRHKSCFFLHGSFLKRLPTEVHDHLLREELPNPITLPLKVDKIYQSRVSSSLVFSVSNVSNKQHSLNAVKSLSNRPCCSATPHNNNRQDSCSQFITLFYCHLSWGSQAKKCRAPCSRSENHSTLAGVHSLLAGSSTSFPLVYFTQLGLPNKSGRLVSA